MNTYTKQIKTTASSIAILVVFGVSIAGAPTKAQNPARQPELTVGSILDNSRTLAVISRKSTVTIPADNIKAQLLKHKHFSSLGLMIVDDCRNADLLLEVAYPVPLTFDYTFIVKHRRTSVVLASGKVIAWDGLRAAPGIAKKTVKQLQKIKAEHQSRTATRTKTTSLEGKQNTLKEIESQ